MLDNPAWWALNTLHKGFSQGTDRAKRYRKGFLPFIACTDSLDDLTDLVEPGEVFYVIGRLPVLPKGWTMEFELPCAQMILPATAATTTPVAAAPPPPIETLGPGNAIEMFDLINSIQPGYYNIDTCQLGNYYGIREHDGIREQEASRQKGRLVAMAGERMRFHGFSELSAICTDPSYTGRGYAQHLITHICRQQITSNITPFLHVSLANTRAIKLYEHMGFRHRREISFWRCKKH